MLNRTVVAAGALLVGTLLAQAPAPSVEPQAKSKQEIVQYMQETQQRFLAAIKDLSAEQWSYKPTPEHWSVAEVAEHITLSEKMFGDAASAGLKAEPTAQSADAKKTAERDAFLAKAIPDRSKKAQAPDMLKPTGKWADKQALMAEFQKLRQANLEFVNANDEQALRSRKAPAPFANNDLLQLLLFMTAHTDRHLKQIDEVKASAGFPKN